MRRRKATYAELETRVGQLTQQNHLLMMALQTTVVDGEAVRERVSDDGWTYTFRAYRLTSAHGGVVVVRAHCGTNQQRDSVTAAYLDDVADLFPADSVAVQSAIGRLKVARQRAIDAEQAA
jgi:hypothetical protein